MNFWPYPCSLHTNIIKFKRKKKPLTESLTTSKISTWQDVNMFSTTHTVTTLSHHNQIITSTTTLLKHLKSLLPPTIIIFCCFTLNSTRNNFHWLTNYSHYIINSRLIWLHAFHFTHLNQPLKIQRYCTTLISLLNTHEKNFTPA